MSVKKTAVVTGAAGFLGSHLTDRLLNEGYRVIGMDNLVTGNVRNIEHLAGNPDFDFIKHDVTKFIYLPGKVDLIFHFASPASPLHHGVTRASIDDQSATTKRLPGAGIIDGRSIPFSTSVTRLP